MKRKGRKSGLRQLLLVVGAVLREGEGRKHGALHPQKPLRLIRDREVGGQEF